MIAAQNIRTCHKCKEPYQGDDMYMDKGICPKCTEKALKGPSKFESDEWRKYITYLKERDWTDKQLKCPEHKFERVPKSGMYLGISLWRCLYCDAVTQAS